MEEQNNVKEERKKYSINSNGQAIVPFQSIANMQYIHSNQFANIVAATFRKTFADFEGCLFETMTSGEPYMSFYFNHGKSSSDLPYACELVNAAAKGTDVISRMRQRDSLMKDGDRYFLTQDAIDIFSELVPDFYRNKNNKIDWKKYVSETNDPTLAPNTWDRGNWGRTPQFTMVTLVDVNQLARLVYGSYDEATNEYFDYKVTIVGCMDTPNPYQQYNRLHNYMLEIKQVPVHAIQDACRNAGLVQGSGLITGL